jgi:cytidine deaminase
MKKEKISFEYEVFDSIHDLSEENKVLVSKANQISKTAYAPYSKFHVGAAVELEDGQIFVGSNQENASYPVGTCAERGLLAYVNANFPNIKVKKLAVSTINIDFPLPPCGMCRQYILEIEKKQNDNIALFLSGNEGQVIKVDAAKDLLPLHFTEDFLD